MRSRSAALRAGLSRIPQRIGDWGRRMLGGRRSVDRRDFLRAGGWDYSRVPQFAYGEETSYRKGIAFLDGHGDIEDWGCGTAWAKRYVRNSTYMGIDASPSRFVDRVVDLRTYRSDVDCIFIRHVLEHTFEWKTILTNAVASFRRRMVLVIFTPFADETRQIASWSGIPDISFRKDDLTECFGHLIYTEEMLFTNTQYEREHIFYIQKMGPAPISQATR